MFNADAYPLPVLSSHKVSFLHIKSMNSHLIWVRSSKNQPLIDWPWFDCSSVNHNLSNWKYLKSFGSNTQIWILDGITILIQNFQFIGLWKYSQVALAGTFVGDTVSKFLTSHFPNQVKAMLQKLGTVLWFLWACRKFCPDKQQIYSLLMSFEPLKLTQSGHAPIILSRHALMSIFPFR